MTLDIIVEQLRPVNGSGNLRAFLDLILPDGTEVKNCRIVQQPGQRPWLSLPQSEWVGKDGNKRYTTLVKLPSDLHQAAERAAIEAFQGGDENE